MEKKKNYIEDKNRSTDEVLAELQSIDDNYMVSESNAQAENTQPTVNKEIQPEQSSQQKTELHLTFIDQTHDAQVAAREAGEARLTRELNDGSKFNRFVKGIWKGNIAKDYYRQKYIREANNEILDNQDIYYFEKNGDEKISERAKMATIERFQSGYAESIDTIAGEHKISADAEFSNQLKDLIRQNVTGKLSDHDLEEEKNRLVFEKYGKQKNNEDEHRIDNLFQISQAVKGAIEHGESMDEVLDNMQISVGESRTGMRTEANYNKIDKVIEKLQQSKLGLILKPETIAAGAAIAFTAVRLGNQRVIGAAAMTVLPGVAAGAFAGIRENKLVKDERAQHIRDIARGDEFLEDDTRRIQMEQTRYETRSARELIDSLKDSHAKIEASGADNEALQAALDSLAAVETRINLSGNREADLISYKAGERENERLELGIKRAELKIELNNRLTPELRSTLKLGDGTVDDMVLEHCAAFAMTIEQDMTEKDKAFQKLKASRVKGAVVKGALVGIALGVAGQEAVAAFDPSRAGLLEQLAQHQSTSGSSETSNTLLAGLAGNSFGEHISPSDEYTTHQIGLGDKGTIKVSNDHLVQNNPDGTISLIDSNGKVTVGDLPVNPDGSLPEESLTAMRAEGMSVLEIPGGKDAIPDNTTKAVGLGEYLSNHDKEVTNIKRDFWWDNDTVKADENETRLSLGGVDSDGTIRMNMAGMQEGGSTADGSALELKKELREGDVKLFLTGSRDTQSSAFAIDVKPDGSISIPQDSPAAELFSTDNGEVTFKGGFAELAQVGATDPDGTAHIRPMATMTGENAFSGSSAESLTDTVKGMKHELSPPSYTVTTAGFESSGSGFTEVAPVLPIYSRRAMEDIIPGGVESADNLKVDTVNSETQNSTEGIEPATSAPEGARLEQSEIDDLQAATDKLRNTEVSAPSQEAAVDEPGAPGEALAGMMSDDESGTGSLFSEQQPEASHEATTGQGIEVKMSDLLNQLQRVGATQAEAEDLIDRLGDIEAKQTGRKPNGLNAIVSIPEFSSEAANYLSRRDRRFLFNATKAR